MVEIVTMVLGRRSEVSALQLPGFGAPDMLRRTTDGGIAGVRIATHCTEADCAEQHIAFAAKTGFDTVGFLKLAPGPRHMRAPAGWMRRTHKGRVRLGASGCGVC